MSDNNYDLKDKTLALVKYAKVTPRLFDLLLNNFRSLDDIMLAEISELASLEGISDNIAQRVFEADQFLERAAGYRAELAQKNVQIITRFDDNYPPHLLEINDPPPLLYSRGKTPDVSMKIVALVGSNMPTQEGLALTVQTAKALTAKRVQVVTSLDRGIDAAVHLGRKSAGSDSFAVIDRGFDNIEGEGAIPLAIDIVQTGGIISEYPPEEPFNNKNFKETNRLIAGMAQAVVITEIGADAERVNDILEYCHQIGKLCFLLIDLKSGPIPDESALAKAAGYGAVIMSGPDKIDDIVKSLV